MQKTNFNRSQIFGYKNGIPVVVAKKADVPLVATQGELPTETYEEQAEVQAASSDFVPAWVAFDRKVLRFEGFFKEPVHESSAENFRVRKIKVYYYLEDDSM